MKYAPSALIGRLSRSAGSTTASHNRFGSYLRNRVIPTNPTSALQTQVRSNMTTLSQAWRGLTSAQRAGWATLGAQMTRTDSLGIVYDLTGFMAFISINRNKNTVGAATVSTDAPAHSPPASLISATLTATA